jgi:hypothetical protein
MIHNDKYHLRVSDMGGNCVIDATLTSDTMGPALEELQWSVKVGGGDQKRAGCLGRPITPDIVMSQWFLILPQNGDFSTVRLQTLIKWRTQGMFPIEYMNSSQVWAKLLSFAFPQGRPDTTNSWSPQDFYRSVHVPDKGQAVTDQIQSDRLDCRLYSFQKRAVRWMLRREGVDIESNGLVSMCQRERDTDALFYHSTDIEGRRCLVSHLLGIVSTEMTDEQSPTSGITGGILAEEMGGYLQAKV